MSVLDDLRVGAFSRTQMFERGTDHFRETGKRAKIIVGEPRYG
jgi:hypothetical protein